MKTIFITGASSGFGKATARLFSEIGWNVIATMRSPENEVELNKMENVLVCRLDVLDTDSIKAAIEEGISRFGKIDVLVNSAGYGLMGVFESASREQIQRQYAVNVFGLMDVTRAMLSHFRANAQGIIINISSFGGVVALPFGGLYNSSKFAVEGFSESLSHELLSFNIAVKIIEPGAVQTNFRSGLEFIKNEIPAYTPLITSFFERYANVTQNIPKASAEDVAETIYTAVSDGNTSQLRYVVGNDAQFYIDTKLSNSEEDFLGLFRKFFIH